MLFIQLPICPSTNNLFDNVAGRGRIKSKRYQAWRKEAGQVILMNKPKLVELLPLETPLMIRVFVPTRPGRDCSNYIKAPEDLMVEHEIIPDDSWPHVAGVMALFDEKLAKDVMGINIFSMKNFLESQQEGTPSGIIPS